MDARQEPRSLASKLPTPREVLTFPPPGLNGGFTGMLSDVRISHCALVTFLKVAEGDQGEFRCASFVE